MKKKYIDGFLNLTEKVGNALPHPALIFALFALAVLVLSYFLNLIGLSTIHPTTNKTIEVLNLLSVEGMQRILTSTIENFTSFAPLGIVLVALLGIGVAEHSGLISSVLRLVVNSTPKKYITFILVFCGVISNVASDVGYVLIIPLGAVIFMAIDRHPIAGIAAAFAGVSGGFTANVLLGTTDALLSGLSQEAAQIIDSTYLVTPVANYYFMFVSTFIISILGTVITEKVIIPRLGEYKDHSLHDISFIELNSDEKKGLYYATGIFIIFLIISLFGLIPEDGFFRDYKTGSFSHSPYIKGIITIVFILGALMGVAYGIGAKTIKSSKDVINAMTKTMSTLGPYLVLVFFAAQFIAYFKWSNLGIIIAVNGAIWLKSLSLGAIPTILIFIFVCAFLNMFIGSASAKWALLAPVFIPMFMLLGYTPEFVQVAYRIGDSSTNLISPMMSFFALIIVYFEKYEKNSGLGTVISTMLPYSIAFLISWSIFLVIWILLGLPLGPGSTLFLN